MSAMLADEVLVARLQTAAAACVSCLKGGGKLLLAGNGGSAADAQHIAAEFVSRLSIDRPGMAAIALTTDTSILTAVGNDYGFEHLFARQIQAIGRPGDVLIAYSTSGSSPNILHALTEARRHGMTQHWHDRQSQRANGRPLRPCTGRAIRPDARNPGRPPGARPYALRAGRASAVRSRGLMEAIVLAGGLGTRLRSTVPDLPKVMAPVCGRPFLEILLSSLATKGCRRAILSLGYLAHRVQDHFGPRFAGIDLAYEVESVPLGTGGALRRALDRCEADHVLVLNGDTYLDLEIEEVESRWQQKPLPDPRCKGGGGHLPLRPTGHGRRPARRIQGERRPRPRPHQRRALRVAAGHRPVLSRHRGVLAGK